MAVQIPIAGIYGKLPSFSDFIQRGVPSSFVRPLDEWLSKSMIVSRSVLGESWQQCFLTSVPWRFAFDPGVAGPSGWVGVIASSVDKVHREYPITVAMPLPPVCRISDLTGDISVILSEAQTIALNLIADQMAPDDAVGALCDLTEELYAVGFSDGAKISSSGETLQMDIVYPSIGMMTAHLSQYINPNIVSRPISAWWHLGWNDQRPASLLAEGFPHPETFSSFLSGNWPEPDWVNAPKILSRLDASSSEP